MAAGAMRALLARGEVTYPAARWRKVTALVLSVAGLGVSVYLTVDHFARVALTCPDTGIVNCAKVTTSAQSYFLGIPVAVLGLAFYVVMTGLNLPVAWRSTDRRVHLVRLVLSIAGIAFVLYLVAAELLIIGNICLWCTSVHVVTFLLLLVTITTVPAMLGWATAREPQPRAASGRGRGPQSNRAATGRSSSPGSRSGGPSGGRSNGSRRPSAAKAGAGDKGRR